MLLKEHLLDTLYVNKMYILCMICLTLKNFVSHWHVRYNQFYNLAMFYKQRALKLIREVRDKETLFLLLQQDHYLQSDKLINIMVQNVDDFREILNSPLVFKVLYSLWMGNREYSNNFLMETYMY